MLKSDDKNIIDLIEELVATEPPFWAYSLAKMDDRLVERTLPAARERPARDHQEEVRSALDEPDAACRGEDPEQPPIDHQAAVAAALTCQDATSEFRSHPSMRTRELERYCMTRTEAGARGSGYTIDCRPELAGPLVRLRPSAGQRNWSIEAAARACDIPFAVAFVGYERKRAFGHPREAYEGIVILLEDLPFMPPAAGLYAVEIASGVEEPRGASAWERVLREDGPEHVDVRGDALLDRPWGHPPPRVDGVCLHCGVDAGPGNGICDACLALEPEADGIHCVFDGRPSAWCHVCEVGFHECAFCERYRCYECGSRLDWWDEDNGRWHFGETAWQLVLRDTDEDSACPWDRLVLDGDGGSA